MFGHYGVRLGVRVCAVTVFTGEAPDPTHTAAQDDAGMSVLTTLCDL